MQEICSDIRYAAMSVPVVLFACRIFLRLKVNEKLKHNLLLSILKVQWNNLLEKCVFAEFKQIAES